jgi:4-carboxymuconolactone decarboxylase
MKTKTGGIVMTIKESGQELHQKYLDQDPELAAIVNNYAFSEVLNDVELPDKTRLLSNLAYLLGCQGQEEFELMLGVALDNGLTPIEAREVVYQAVDYLGLGRVLPFIKVMNAVFEQRQIKLPLAKQGKVGSSEAERLAAGEQTQIDIFGAGMKGFAKKSTINRWLVANCFGDFYTRGGLDYQERELITFCYLAGQADVRPQLLAHAQANFKNGNSAELLTKVALTNEIFVGYPRTLNTLSAIKEAAEQYNN